MTLNDIEFIRNWLSNLPDMMALDDVVVAMTKVHGEKGGKHVHESINNVVESADEDMMNKIASIIEHIGQKVSRLTIDSYNFIERFS